MGILIGIYEKYIDQDDMVSLTTQTFIQIVGREEYRDQNTASFLLETNLVENTLKCLHHPSIKEEVVLLILELHELLYAN